MPGKPEDPGDLWTFCSSVYAEPGVAEACLRLQDEHGADICLLLAALWSAADGPGLLGAEDFAALDELVAPFRDNVVRPLRQVRRWMKAAGYHPDPLRERIKAEELAAEQREIALIAYWLTRKAPRRPAADAERALTGFLAWLGAEAGGLEPLIAAAYACSRSR
jgi:uncharacterized protein (TIGR02444 family)